LEWGTFFTPMQGKLINILKIISKIMRIKK
jgi:hypothetical protein